MFRQIHNSYVASTVSSMLCLPIPIMFGRICSGYFPSTVLFMFRSYSFYVLSTVLSMFLLCFVYVPNMFYLQFQSYSIGYVSLCSVYVLLLCYIINLKPKNGISGTPPIPLSLTSRVLIKKERKRSGVLFWLWNSEY